MMRALSKTLLSDSLKRELNNHAVKTNARKVMDELVLCSNHQLAKNKFSMLLSENDGQMNNGLFAYGRSLIFNNCYRFRNKKIGLNDVLRKCFSTESKKTKEISIGGDF